MIDGKKVLFSGMQATGNLTLGKTIPEPPYWPWLGAGGPPAALWEGDDA